MHVSYIHVYTINMQKKNQNWPILKTLRGVIRTKRVLCIQYNANKSSEAGTCIFSHKLTKIKIQVKCTFLFYVQLICKTKKLPFFKTVGKGIQIHVKGVLFWQAPARPLGVFHRKTRLIKLKQYSDYYFLSV